MEQSVTRVSGKGKIARVLLVALLSLVGLSVIGVGNAYAAGPVVKSLTPASGSADGGATVTIAGSAFTGATAVTFGGVPATSFTVVTGIKITAVVPPAQNNTANVSVVVTVGGVQSTPQAPGDDTFTYTWNNPPTVTGTGLIPATALQSGTTVTVTAAGTWTAGQLVSVAGFSNKVPSAIYPVVTGGTGSFTITNLGSTTGTGTGTVSPTAAGAVGPVAGGSSVVIVGTHLGGASSVNFGSTPSTSVTVNSGTQITATVPPGVSGSVDITVTTPNATSPTSNADSFNYVGPPVVTGLTTTASPAGGPTGGGTQVTLAGSGYNNVTAVTFGTTPATSFLVNGLNSITAVAPAGTGTVDVTVTVGGTTSAISSADHYTYNGTLAVANGNAAYSNSPGTDVPVTGTSQSGTTVTITAAGAWTAGQHVTLSGFTNGLTAGNYTVLGAGTGTFTITFAPTLSGSGTGTVLVQATVTPAAVYATSQTGSVLTVSTGTSATPAGTWFPGQVVYLTGFTNGIAAGNYTVTSGTTGSFTVTNPGSSTGTGTGSAIPYQAQSFNAATLVTGGGTINPASLTVTAQPSSGTVTAVGSQLIYIPAQSTPTSYTVGSATTWNRTVTTTGIQTATFQICQTAPSASCTTGTMSYSPAGTGFYVGNQLPSPVGPVTVVEDTGSGIVVPASATSGSTFTSVTAPSEADLPATNSGFNVVGIGGYQSITPVPTGLSLVPGTLTVTGGDSFTTGKYTATLCTAAMGYVPGTCTANQTGNFQTTYPYIETSLNVGTQIGGGSQLSLPTISATWQVNASSGSVSSYETEFVVVTNVGTLGSLVLDAYPSDLASFLNQGLSTPAPNYAAPAPRWTVNITGGGPTAPTITSASSATFTAGTAGTFTVTATGSPAPTFTETGALPSGVTLDPTTGVLSGTPGATTGGTYPITITAANGNLPNATQSFTLTVDQAPTITSGNSTTFTAGTAGTFTATATGFPAPTFSETGALPSGVTLNSTTGVLSGTPGATTGGAYPITITASNGTLPNATQSFTLTVDQAPSITSANSTTFTVGTAGTFTVAATGFPAPTFSETGALPSGVTLNPTTGVLSGTPAADTGAAYPITITATNGTSPNGTQSFTLTVNEAPTITSGNSTTFTVGTAGTFTVTATGFPASTFTETGALPSGVTLNATTGVLSGTPIIGSTGTYPVTIKASNGVLPNATQSFTLTVNTVPVPPTITSANSTTFTVGTAGTFTVTASGSPAPTFSETGALPTGVTLNATTGVLSGTPAAGTAATYPITITATNGNLPNATQSFTLTVNQVPVITSANSTSFTVGTAGTFTVTATGSPAPTFSETGALPSGVTLNATTGVLSGTPAAGTGGLYAITITATNGVLPNATQAFQLTVTAPPTPPVITSATSTTFTAGTAGTFSVTATGYPIPTFTETGALPTGVTLATNGTLAGTPAAGTGKAYPITITAANGNLPNATQSFTLTVDQAPAITSASSTTFDQGQAGTFTVTSTGFPSATISETGALPAGVTLAGGILSGTPAVGSAGSYPITLTANNGVLPNATQSFTLTVATVPNAPSILSVTPGDGQVTITWAPGASGGRPILSYEADSVSTSDFCTANAPATSCTVTGLTNGVPYSFTVFATNANGNSSDSLPSATVTPTSNGAIPGYWMATSGGAVLTNGAAVSYGSPAGLALNAPIVALTPTPDRKGYWMVGADGGIFNYGDAAFYGSAGGEHLNKPIVGMAATSDGKGYWLVASDGGVFSYGDAAYEGSLGATVLNAPIVGMAGNGTNGYWLVAADGGVFAYGSAPFHGSAGNQHLVQPVTGIAATVGGTGYYLVAADGGVFAYNAPFYGSASGVAAGVVMGITAGAGGGYTLATDLGGAYSYGAGYFGNQTNSGVIDPVISISS